MIIKANISNSIWNNYCPVKQLLQVVQTFSHNFPTHTRKQFITIYQSF